MAAKKWWQSRTIWVAIGTIVIGVLSTLDLSELVTDAAALRQIQAGITMAVGVLNLVLRFVTTEPITSVGPGQE